MYTFSISAERTVGTEYFDKMLEKKNGNIMGKTFIGKVNS